MVNPSPSSSRTSRALFMNWHKNYPFLVSLHLLCLSIYIVPIFVWKSHHDKGLPVLDELHIVTPEQIDIYQTHESFFQTNDTVWMNDYWGRPMNSTSSHKSWRPLTILSFRFLRFPGPIINWNDLVSHRLVNILLHSLTAEWVALLALAIFCPKRKRQTKQQDTVADASTTTTSYSFWLYTLTKLLFCLHPTHVEVTANAANRPHLIAVACTTLLANPNLHCFWSPFLVIAGLLSAETFLFGIVPAAATLLLINLKNNQQTRALPTMLHHQALWAIRQCGLRITIMVTGALLYYWGRQKMEWLSIPTGLIRPAENPYFRLTGRERIVNYAYVTALHVAKSWDLDWVGFSHEYGYECLTPIESFRDIRLTIPIATALILLVLPTLWFLGLGRYKCTTDTTQQAWSTPFLLWLFHLSWLATLFPIMGIVKVGTFVADRIVVTSSVSVCILVAHLFAGFLTASPGLKQKTRKETATDCDSSLDLPMQWRVLLILGLLSMGWRRIHLRAWEWMDPLPLLKSSLKTCPRSAKSHLEISKIYSGLYAEHYDLKTARWHLRQVEKIDATYCDVHFQFAHVAVQEQAYLELEQRLVKALMCEYTSNQAMSMWTRYWDLALGSPDSPAYRRNDERRISYHREIRQKLKEDEKKLVKGGDDLSDDSHFVRWRG